MLDLILQSAGVAGIVVAPIHGVLGETMVFARAMSLRWSAWRVNAHRRAGYCSGGSPLVRFLARSISVTAIRISARVLRSGASSIACFSGGP
jgi:hypothetical protein